MTLDPGYAEREMARACNAYFARYGLGQPHLPVVAGLTHQQSVNLVRSIRWGWWLLGWRDDQIPSPAQAAKLPYTQHVGGWPLVLTLQWLHTPGSYYGPGGVKHPGGLLRHRARLHAVRTANDSPYVFPVLGPLTEGRTDRGQDMETVPGAHILAIDSGIVTATPNDSAIGGLGEIVVANDHEIGGYPAFYAFHLDNCRVSQGQRIPAGHLLATTSEHPPGAEDMPGHVEYGLATDRSGSIEPASDATHYTRSGRMIHGVLHQLDPTRIGGPPIIA